MAAIAPVSAALVARDWRACDLAPGWACAVAPAWPMHPSEVGQLPDGRIQTGKDRVGGSLALMRSARVRLAARGDVVREIERSYVDVPSM